MGLDALASKPILNQLIGAISLIRSEEDQSRLLARLALAAARLDERSK